MKISELIEQLKRIEETHGDLPTVILFQQGEGMDLQAVKYRSDGIFSRLPVVAVSN